MDPRAARRQQLRVNRMTRILCTLALLLLSSGLTAQAAVPSTATLSTDTTHAVWPKEDGSGFWLSTRSSPAAEWAQPREISVRGLAGTPVFSPDGQKIAFENARGG